MVVIYFSFVALVLFVDKILRALGRRFYCGPIKYLLKVCFEYKWNKCIMMVKETYLPIMLFSFVNVVHVVRDGQTIDTWYKFFNLSMSILVIFSFNLVAILLTLVALYKYEYERDLLYKYPNSY